MELVACLSTGKGTWAHLSQLVKEGSWEKVILLTNDFGIQKYQKDEKTILIQIDSEQEIDKLRDEIKTKLKPVIKGTEVALNFVSGTGKEHMALISALLRLGLCIRFYAKTKDKIEEI